MIKIRNDIEIAESQLVFKFTRSSGPGGQNVNKVNTRVTVYFDAAGCDSLTDVQKQRILSRLKTRADKAGTIRVVSQRHRTQKANKAVAIERLVKLLGEALKTKSERKKTGIPRYAIEQRLKQKKQRSLLKRQRAKADYFCERGKNI
jgi:ribosome-associated protein